jgi:hypothetical protein
MKAYGEVDAYIHVFLTSAVVGGEWSRWLINHEIQIIWNGTFVTFFNVLSQLSLGATWENLSKLAVFQTEIWTPDP